MSDLLNFLFSDDNEDDIIAEAYEQFLMMQERQIAAKTEAQNHT